MTSEQTVAIVNTLKRVTTNEREAAVLQIVILLHTFGVDVSYEEVQKLL